MIYTYWEGYAPTIIQLCIEGLIRHNKQVRVLTVHDVAEDKEGAALLELTEGMLTAYRSDLVRLWALRNGGVWVDADCIHIAPMDWFEDWIEEEKIHLAGVHNKHLKNAFGSSGLLACPFGVASNSTAPQQLMKEALSLIHRMKKGEHVPYGSTSVGLLSQYYKANKNQVVRLEHWRLNPVHWQRAKEVFNLSGTEVLPEGIGLKQYEYGKDYNPRASTYHLTNAVVDRHKNATEKELLRDDSLLSFLFQKSLGLAPGVFPRSCSLSQWIQEHNAKEGVEIGVFQGDNLRQILQQNPKIKMWGVDKWNRFHPIPYSETDDVVVSKQRDWKHTQRLAQANLWPFHDRCTLIEKTSLEAAKGFPDNSMDFVFIDADHSYHGCLLDIETWAPKIKKGGFISGHDIDHPNKNFGVRQAVEKYFPQKEIELGLDTTWKVKI